MGLTALTNLLDNLSTLALELPFLVLDAWPLIMGAAVVIDICVTLPLYFFYRRGKREEQAQPIQPTYSDSTSSKEPQ